MKSERGDTTEDSITIQKIIREYYKQHYANKLNNIDVIDKFFETNY